jgi:ABC-2 type transport system permease protein
VLGAIWSVLNPIVFLAVFSFVVRVTGNLIPYFPIYLLSGLLGWNLFQSSLTNGARSIIENANLVKKVAFPREILPISAVGVAMVDFVLQSFVLLLFIIVSGHGVGYWAAVLYPLALITLIVFTMAMTLLVSSTNVRYRDVQHLLNLGLLVWFWMTPIVYPSGLAQNVTIKGVSAFNILLLNPLTSVTLCFQRALYGYQIPTSPGHPVVPAVSVSWLVGVTSLVLVGSILFLWYTWSTFFKLSGDFAEEL